MRRHCFADTWIISRCVLCVVSYINALNCRDVFVVSPSPSCNHSFVHLRNLQAVGILFVVNARSGDLYPFAACDAVNTRCRESRQTRRDTFLLEPFLYRTLTFQRLKSDNKKEIITPLRRGTRDVPGVFSAGAVGLLNLGLTLCLAGFTANIMYLIPL